MINVEAGNTRLRIAFTLLEMLVAMTLTLFIMVIISTAFVAGLETFRGLKAIGDMHENLRQAAQRLRSDLQEDHFEGHQHMGDTVYNQMIKPTKGFFRFTKPTTPIAEGVDLDNLPSFRATDQVLHFSNHLRGDRPQDFYVARIPTGPPFTAADPKPFDPGPLASPNPFFKHTTFFNQPVDARFQQAGTFSSQWAEIAYYLVRIGTTDQPTNPGAATGTPLHALYRVQRVVVPRNDQLMKVVPVSQLAAYAELSCQPEAGAIPQFLEFNTPEDLATDTDPAGHVLTGKDPPAKRGFDSNPALGAALLLSNVITFQIEVSHLGEPFHDMKWFDPATKITAYDSAFTHPFSAPNMPFHKCISGLRITIRIWDPVTEQTRQATIIQDM